MSIHLPTNHLLREILGAVAGMGIALLIYLGFQQYSYSTLRGSLVNTTGSSSASTDATGGIEAEGAKRIAERDRLIAERLASLAARHASSSANETADAPSLEPVIADAPTVPANLTAPVSERERLALRAERIPTADRVAAEDVAPASSPASDSSSSSSATAVSELAGVPLSPTETVIESSPAAAFEPAEVIPDNQPLPKSGPAENGMIILALAAAMAVIVRRRQTAR
jgi:hypothetical protein